jgi:hypothetical protein
MHGDLAQANKRDGIYSEKLPDGTAAGSHLLLDLTKSEAKRGGFTTEFAIFVTDDEMRPGRRRVPGGPGGRGPGDGPPPGDFGPGDRPPGPPPGDFDRPPPPRE